MHELFLKPPSRKGDQPFAPSLVGAPEFQVGNPLDPFPDLFVVGVFRPPPAEVSVEEGRHVIGNPGGDMDPIGDVMNRDIGFWQRGPESSPHPQGHRLVQTAHSICSRCLF